jgi:hypothetical protein|tara:strand:- start:250 stop:549 length:300 start_codon:yes stop_codon:yes gene_type:complete
MGQRKKSVGERLIRYIENKPLQSLGITASAVIAFVASNVYIAKQFDSPTQQNYASEIRTEQIAEDIELIQGSRQENSLQVTNQATKEWYEDNLPQKSEF